MVVYRALVFWSTVYWLGPRSVVPTFTAIQWQQPGLILYPLTYRRPKVQSQSYWVNMESGCNPQIHHMFLFFHFSVSNTSNPLYRNGGGGRAHGSCRPLAYTLNTTYFSLKFFFSANYKTLDFGPRCQENAYLALWFYFFMGVGPPDSSSRLRAFSIRMWEGAMPPLSKISASASAPGDLGLNLKPQGK